MNLDFLKEVKLEKTEPKQRAPRLDTVPTAGAHLRLFNDGRVFPSQELVDTHNLEYTEQDNEEVSYGFDIVDTQNFPNYPQENPRIVMIALVPRDQPKVDLFHRTKFNEDGTPKNSVLTQGTKQTWLIELIEEVYDVILFEDERYVDLMIHTSLGLTTPNDIYMMPKTVARGERKGEVSYTRRTNTTLWPLTIFEEVAQEEEAVEETNYETTL